MTEFARRKADQLSGGQQQRVALARALVLRPRVLLLDEPLGALDAQLRKNLQVELKALQAELGITFIFVTHDQSEALTMSDRIAVMNKGRVEQAASPKAIYEEPDTVFVADFLGVSNLLDATAVGQDGAACTVQVGDRTLRAQQGATDARGEVKVMIRPERIAIEPHANRGEERLPGIVERSVFLGGSYEVHVRVLGGELLRAMVPNDGGVSAGRPGAGRGGQPAPTAASRPPPWSRARRSASICPPTPCAFSSRASRTRRPRRSRSPPLAVPRQLRSRRGEPATLSRDGGSAPPTRRAASPHAGEPAVRHAQDRRDRRDRRAALRARPSQQGAG